MMTLRSKLEKLLGGDTVQQRPEIQDSRRHPRLRHCLRVEAPELPDFKALTIDVSASGVGLETFSEIAVGQKLKMRLEIGVFPISLEGVVKWCEAVSDGIYHVGVSIEASSPHNLHAYRRYVNNEIEAQEE